MIYAEKARIITENNKDIRTTMEDISEYIKIAAVKGEGSIVYPMSKKQDPNMYCILLHHKGYTVERIYPENSTVPALCISWL